MKSGISPLLLMAMEFKKALKSSRSICLLLMIAILAGMLFGFKPMLSMEYKAYDLCQI